MKSVGPQPLPHSWAGYYYCRPCNRVVDNIGQHAPTCGALQNYCLRTGKSPQEALTKLRPSECPACYLGFKGKNYCTTCGNTKEPALDETGRRRIFGGPAIPPSDLTASLSRNNELETGQWYEFILKSDKFEKQEDGELRRRTNRKTYQARCLGSNGPITMFSNPETPFGSPLRVHRLDIDAIKPIDEPDEEESSTPSYQPSYCNECGHIEHKGQCGHMEKDGPKFIGRCQCGRQPTEAEKLQAQYEELLGRKL